MLVPRTRLLVWFALVVVPFATVAGALPPASFLSAAILIVFAIVVTFDALAVRGRLAGIAVVVPELIRLQKDRRGVIETRIGNKSMAAQPLRIGLPLPPEIATDDEARSVLLPAGAPWSRFEWPCTPAQRGQFFLERAYLEASSPLDFWAIRSTVPIRSELRVYPNLFEERKNVAALFLKRGAIGAHAQRQAGQGREFEKLRDYLHGDSIQDVHWKASAKRGHPVTKVFQVERTQEVYVIVDASRLTTRKVVGPKSRVSDAEGSHSRASDDPYEAENRKLTPETNVLERFVSAALVVGLAAEQQGDQFGLLTFSDRVLSFVRAKSGQSHYDACRDRLYALQPQTVSPDFDELCSFIRLHLRKRALLIFLTALDDPLLAESFSRSVELICRQHLVLVNMLAPAGAQPLFTDSAAGIDDIYRQLGGHLRWRQLRELEIVLHRRGVRLSLLDPAKIAALLVGQLADVKARQLI